MNQSQMNRRYVAGIDGGGTKTACMIVDDAGALLAYAVAEGSNHQISGFFCAMENVCLSVDRACAQSGIARSDLSFIYLGMAGADSDEDVRLLSEGFSGLFGAIPFRVVNDAWIAFACEAGQGWGAVSICGTGSNLAVKDRQGTLYSVRALRYMLGNYGGGHHLAEIAMHHAFRCDEHTGPDTRLAGALPAYCGCADMDELARRVYESDYQYHKNFNIPKLVFDLAAEGDGVCVSIIAEMGAQIGDMLGRLIRHAGLDREEVPVVLAGSQYTKDVRGLMVGPLETALRTYAPDARIRVVRCPPVVGAALSALEQIGSALDARQCLLLKQRAQELEP